MSDQSAYITYHQSMAWLDLAHTDVGMATINCAELLQSIYDTQKRLTDAQLAEIEPGKKKMSDGEI